VTGHQPAVIGEAALIRTSHRKVHIPATWAEKRRSPSPLDFPDGFSLKTPPQIGLC
jgi:hypothetical protein